jgi:hypothetical protein
MESPKGQGIVQIEELKIVELSYGSEEMTQTIKTEPMYYDPYSYSVKYIKINISEIKLDSKTKKLTIKIPEYGYFLNILHIELIMEERIPEIEVDVSGVEADELRVDVTLNTATFDSEKKEEIR